jgi:cell division control protein 24
MPSFMLSKLIYQIIGHYTLHISWNDSEFQTILLKCRNDEQLRQWLTAIIELKESSVKVDLISAPQTPRMDQNDPLLRYEDDEEDEDENSEGEDNHSPLFMRNRSYSYQHHRYPNEVSSRKASLSNNTVRHFMNGVPGMTLPPLPRSPTQAPNLSNASSSESTLYSPSSLSFPSSPPTSYPSSPTTTARISSASSSNSNNGILPSGALWQRRQQQQNSISEEEDEQEERPLIQHVRARSQSSPNIQRPMHHHHHHQQAPELPTISSANASMIYESKRKSNDYRYDNTTAPTTPSPQTQHEDITKVKVHYFGAIYVVVVPTDIEFEELQKRIESKIKLCGQEFDPLMIGLKYEDEDGDLITISSSEDVQMGFENKGPNNTVNLYVTP